MTPAPAPAVALRAEQAAVDAVLASSAAPAAAVVLDLDARPRVLALGGHAGADPITTSVRPASTVKPLTAWLAAEHGVYRAGEQVTCPGYSPTYPELHCFKEHRALALTEALVVSCNVYFAELGGRLGLEAVSRGLREFGLAHATGLAAGEAPGFIADPAWASARPTANRERWEFVVAAGHGPFEVTPLQLAVAYAKLAALLNEPNATVPDDVRLEIATGLRRVVDDPDGTGHAARVAGLEIAGKTGSGESYPFGADAPEGAVDNGWFVGFAPASRPRRLVAVLVLGSGGGATTAAPLAGKLFAAIGDGSHAR